MKRQRALLRFLRYNGIINSETNIPLEYYSNEKVENLKYLLSKILKNISSEKLSCDIYDKYIENDDYFIYNFPKKLLPIYSRQLRKIKLKYFHKWQEKNLFVKKRNLKISTSSSSRLYKSYQYHEDYINALKIIDQYKESINCPFKPKTNQNDLYFINSYRTPCHSHSTSYYNNNFNYNTNSNVYYNLSSNKNRGTCIKYCTPNKNNKNMEYINSNNNNIIYKYSEKKQNYYFNNKMSGRQGDVISGISPHYSNFNSNNDYYDTLFSQKQNRASFYSDSNNGSVKRQNRSVKVQYLTSKSIKDCNTNGNKGNECSIKKYNKIYNIHLADFDPVYEINIKKSISKNIIRTNSIGLSGAITTNKTNAIFQSETKNNNKKDILKLDFDSINRYNINSISNSNSNSNLISNKNNVNINQALKSNKSVKGNDLMVSQNYPLQNNENEVLENKNKAITITNGYSCSILQDKSKDTNTSGMSNFQYCIYPTARESNKTNKYFNYFNKNVSPSQNKLSKNSNKKPTNLELDMQYFNDLNPKKLDTSSVCNNYSVKNDANQIENSYFTLDPAYKKLTHITLQTLSDEQILELANHYAEQANDDSDSEK